MSGLLADLASGFREQLAALGYAPSSAAAHFVWAQGVRPEGGTSVADLRDLPFEDASLARVVCWFSLIYLAPDARVPAFTELARVVKPGGYLVTAFKQGDGTGHRNPPSSRVKSFGIDFDRYWLSAREMEERFAAAGFALIFRGSTPPEEPEPSYGYMLVRKTDSGSA